MLILTQPSAACSTEGCDGKKRARGLCMKHYMQLPHVVEKQAAYSKTPKSKVYRKKYNKAYQQTPEGKAKRKAYQQTPEQRAYQKAYQQTPERRASRKAYQQTPEGKAKQSAYQKAYYLKKKALSTPAS